jgi:hypothetical protein
MGNFKSKVNNMLNKMPTSNDLKNYSETNNSLRKLAEKYVEKIKKKEFRFYDAKSVQQCHNLLIIDNCRENEDNLIRELNIITNNEYYFVVENTKNEGYVLCIDTSKDPDGFDTTTKN